MRNSHVSRGFEQGTNSGLDQLGDLVAELAVRQAGIKKDRERGFRSRSDCLVQAAAAKAYHHGNAPPNGP